MDSDNHLFPVFLRVDKLQVLIVGGGEVGLEKIGFMFRHSETGNVRLVGKEIKSEIKSLAEKYPDHIRLYERAFEESDLENTDVLIVATEDNALNRSIRDKAKAQGILVNVADTPDICDFYLSSVVKKGDLKIAISSNGKSPTLTKRMRELLEDVLPEEIDELLQNLKAIRDELKGDFQSKVDKLNEITAEMKKKKG